MSWQANSDNELASAGMSSSGAMRASPHPLTMLFRTGLVLVVFGIVLALGWRIAPLAYFGFDEAYNVNLLQNLVEQGHYASRLGTQERYFDAAITSGPTIVFPFALAGRLMGMNLATLRAAAAISLTVCTLVIFIAVWSLLHWLASLVFLAAFITFPPVLPHGLAFM